MNMDTKDLRKTLQTVLRRLPEGEDDDLWASGLIDSLTVVELVATLEDRYGVQFAPEQLRKENFESLACIRRAIEAAAAGGRR